MAMNTIESHCPRCGSAVAVELNLDGFDQGLATSLRRMASHSLCQGCADPERQRPEPVRPQRREVRTPYRDD